MILAKYMAKRFALSLATAFAGVFLLYFILEIQKHMSQFRTVGISVLEAMGLSLLSVPAELYDILPMIVALSALLMSVRLALSTEFSAAQAVGVSGVAGLSVPAGVAALLGVVAVSAIHPFSASLSKSHREFVSYLGSGQSQLVAEEGEHVWLRETRGSLTAMLRISSFSDGRSFRDIDVFIIDGDGTPVTRHHADRAVLHDGAFALYGVKSWKTGPEGQNPELESQRREELVIATSFTGEFLRDNLNRASESPIWKLRSQIRLLDNAGFTSLSHRVRLHMELSKPVLLAAMVFFGASFTLRPARLMRMGVMSGLALISTISVFFLQDFARILGQNGQIPALAAAWIPSIASFCLGLALFFYLEDQ